MINLERKRGSYGCVRHNGWDTCTVCNYDTQEQCDFYMTCKQWQESCEPEECFKCEVYIKREE